MTPPDTVESVEDVVARFGHRIDCPQSWLHRKGKYPCDCYHAAFLKAHRAAMERALAEPTEQEHEAALQALRADPNSGKGVASLVLAARRKEMLP